MNRKLLWFFLSNIHVTNNIYTISIHKKNATTPTQKGNIYIIYIYIYIYICVCVCVCVCG